jgi:hypothetical protein
VERARWWDGRPAGNLKPATYRCPLCGELLPALSEHMLIWPEDDRSRRRHAHTVCVMRARTAGDMPTKAEFERGRRDVEGAPDRGIGRLLARLRRRPRRAS